MFRLDRFWEPPSLEPKSTRVYGPDTFVLVLQQKLGLELSSPDDRLIASVPPLLLRRGIELLPLAKVLAADFPIFVKPVVPKQFQARVYSTAEQLHAECNGLDPAVEVFRSEVISLAAEARAFLLRGKVLDLRVYEGKATADELVNFVHTVVAAVPLPKAVVMDVGIDANGSPTLIEFNAAWGAGLNGCDPELVLPAILAASEPFD